MTQLATSEPVPSAPGTTVEVMRRLAALPEDRRLLAAERVKAAGDFDLPRLPAWNYSLCRRHRAGWVEDFFTSEGEPRQRTVVDRPAPGCRQCGVHFRAHQRVSVPWLFLRGRALLADEMGTGKTVSAAGLVALMHAVGELDRGRVVICVRAPALLQWQAELQRMVPGLQVITATGTRRERIEKYMQPWYVLLIGPQMVINDVDLLLNFQVQALVVDDVDALRHRETKTAYALRKIGQRAPRMVIMTGTPLQKRLHELYAVLEPLGAREVFGSELQFKRRYVREELVTIYDKKLRSGKRTVSQVVGYKHLDEFKRLVAPFALRRTAADLDDVEMPAINPNDVWLELYPRQRAKYRELQTGIITILRDASAGRVEVRQATAMAKLHYGAQICGGLATLGEEDGPEASAKLDWLMGQLVDGDFSDEKVVVFMAYKASIRAAQVRLRAAGVGFETVWGDEPDKAARMRSQERFWEDPSCRVLLGTQAIEQSLNLQVARHLVNYDFIMNPARMAQIAARIARIGSAYKHVFIHNLLTRDTHEERYMPLLEREQALASHIWGEESQLFEALSPMQMMTLISG